MNISNTDSFEPVVRVNVTDVEFHVQHLVIEMTIESDEEIVFVRLLLALLVIQHFHLVSFLDCHSSLILFPGLWTMIGHQI